VIGTYREGNIVDKARKTLREQIIRIVLKSGLPVSADYIGNQLALPAGIELDHLLDDLVTRGLLRQKRTLLANGEVGVIYDLVPPAPQP